jgi:iron complex transport system permease protein
MTVVTDRPRVVHSGHRPLGLLLGVMSVLLLGILSVAVGARTIPPAQVWDLLWHPDGSALSITVHDLRVPRTLLALVVGVGLGTAGVLMQALTRNPLADPGLFGVNAGAALAVVVAVTLFGASGPGSYVWAALLGAALAAGAVYLLGSTGHTASSPTRLALAGVAVAAAVHAVLHGFTTLNATVYNEVRFWLVGTLDGRDLTVVTTVAPLIAVGLLVTVALARTLNTLALGEDAARSLGAHPGRARALGVLAILLLCGAATAGAGPIVFLGLAVPHMVRAVTGPDHRWLLVYSAVWAPVLLLAADLVGRVVARPNEVPVGIVLAFVGAPVFIWLLRRRRVVAA